MPLVHPVVGTNKEISGFSSFTEHENDEEQENVANSSNESSSIGSLSSSDDDEEDSGSKESSFSSFASSVEESLPIKRGLSSYFSGKAKSFTDLSGCANAAVENLSKPENPFNKRRRILTSWSRRASCSSLIVVQEANEENDDGDDEDEDNNGGEKERGRGTAFPSFPPPIPRLRGGDNRKINNGFRPSFSLSDLQTSCPPNF